MKRRDTEKHHPFSEYVFSELRIGNLQGLLKEGDSFSCGIEAYQVSGFKETDFSQLDPEMEKDRFSFCRLLGVPYYVIVVATSSKRFRVHEYAITEKGSKYTILD